MPTPVRLFPDTAFLSITRAAASQAHTTQKLVFADPFDMNFSFTSSPGNVAFLPSPFFYCSFVCMTFFVIIVQLECEGRVD